MIAFVVCYCTESIDELYAYIFAADAADAADDANADVLDELKPGTDYIYTQQTVTALGYLEVECWS